MLDRIFQVKQRVKQNNPRIFCITNRITANDCENVLLAVGASPIISEHPQEAVELTAGSDALAVNLGGINTFKMEMMLLAGETAVCNGIPSVIDLVGVGSSKMRLDFAAEYIKHCHPDVIKGNVSEIKAVCGVGSNASGVDVGNADVVTSNNMEQAVAMMKDFSKLTNSVIIASGVIDLVVRGDEAYAVSNGCVEMSRVCGTGCMLNALTAGFISTGQIMEGAVLSVATWGICGELSRTGGGMGEFKTALMDNLGSITEDVFLDKIRLDVILQQSHKGGNHDF